MGRITWGRFSWRMTRKASKQKALRQCGDRTVPLLFVDRSVPMVSHGFLDEEMNGVGFMIVLENKFVGTICHRYYKFSML